VVTFRDGDHFDGDKPLKQAVVDFAGDAEIERVLVLTQLRVLGYVFNPVSFYWCYRADGSLACMVAELNNTFGERLPEVLRGPELRYEHEKHLHVSPFMGLDQRYTWRATRPGPEHPTLSVHIESHEQGAKAFDATLALTRGPLTARTLRRATARHVVPTLRVLALIYAHALVLWLKRVPIHPRTTPEAS
jgi:DUF1365 family protein